MLPSGEVEAWLQNEPITPDKDRDEWCSENGFTIVIIETEIKLFFLMTGGEIDQSFDKKNLKQAKVLVEVSIWFPIEINKWLFTSPAEVKGQKSS